MNAIHLHLMINHLPLYGTLFAGLLLGYALWAGKQEVRKAALSILVLVALATPVVYFSGENGEDWAEEAGLSESGMEAHEEAGKIAFALVTANGALAAVALALYLFPMAGKLGGRIAVAVFLLSLGVMAWSAWTSTTGGRIRHGEEMGIGTGIRDKP